MKFRQFEREFLRLAFTTSLDLSPASLAFVLGIGVREAEQHMRELVSRGVLELGSDDDGRLQYVMPDRPAQPFRIEAPPIGGPGSQSWIIEEHTGAADGAVDATTTETGGRAGEAPRAIVVRRFTAVAPREPVTSGQAVAAMFLNALVCPGVGSLVGRRTWTGVAQLSLFLAGLPLAVLAIGLPLVLAAWVWGIVTGAQIIAEARE